MRMNDCPTYYDFDARGFSTGNSDEAVT